MSTENPPAFPSQPRDDEGHFTGPLNVGMTLRDWFAGRALAGYLAAPHTLHMNAVASDAAAYLYAMADAMLAERVKGGEA